jgi:SAM-dependent methyltransferase
MRWLLDMLARRRPGGRTLLEIGAGSGLLVAEARRRGLDAVGVEPSRSLVDTAARNGIQLVQGIFPHPTLAGRRFDYVLLVDVIEHVDDPHALLAACRDALAPGGLLMVVTPDIDSMPARLLGRRWWHLRLAHVGYFGAGTFSTLAGRAGLDVSLKRRARWFFPIRYLADRVAVYLPVGGLVRAAGKLPLISGLLRKVIPLNPLDSWVFLLEARRGS